MKRLSSRIHIVFPLTLLVFLSSSLLSQAPVDHSGTLHRVHARSGDSTYWADIHVRDEKARDETSPTSTVVYPLYDWPIEYRLGDRLILDYYVDLNSGTSIADYWGSQHTYNGHNGTDLEILNFREMDRGVRVLAAADGIVSSIVYTNPDRNSGPPFPSAENRVIIQHSDGTYAWYLHLRKNSVTVNVNESIKTGQVLGFAGSSGYSYAPHLHFETGQYINGSWTRRDPFNGPNQPLPSLWKSQEPFAGLNRLAVFDMGVTTQSAAGGNLASIPVKSFEERLSEPAIFGGSEPSIATWVQIQGLQGDTLMVRLKRPDGSIFQTVTTILTSKINYDWFYWYWTFNGNVSPSQYGNWTAEAIANGVTRMQRTIVVGATTQYNPSFTSVAGRSFRINSFTQRETLRVAPAGGPATFQLLNAPGFVQLMNDSIVTIAGLSTQRYRSIYFQSVATNSSSRRDTFWFHLVDPSKAVGPIGPRNYSYNITNGWNLISLPAVEGSSTIQDIFPSALLPVFSYDGKYTEADALVSGKGYWVKFPSEELHSILFGGEDIDAIELRTGWNVIGGPSAPFPVSDIMFEPADLIIPPFFEFTGMYFPADTLYPTRGYWVRAKGNGTIRFR